MSAPRLVDASAVAGFIDALHFAAGRHRDQRRKGAERSPYVSHLVEVAHLLVSVGGFEDMETLQGAALHDVVEDTPTTLEEIELAFGPVVRRIVGEVSDDKELPHEERRRIQVERAPTISLQAQRIKIADKISNVRSIVYLPPQSWTRERRIDYLNWAERVVAGCSGASPELERMHHEAVAEGRRVLEGEPGR